MCVAVVTHTIHQYFKIMKKLENPKWEECRNYLRNTILPRLQEIQRDMFGKGKVGLEIDVEPEGEYIVCHAYTIMYGKVNKYLHLHLSCVLDREKLESEYKRLTDFIKEHSA